MGFHGIYGTNKIYQKIKYLDQGTVTLNYVGYQICISKLLESRKYQFHYFQTVSIILIDLNDVARCTFNCILASQLYIDVFMKFNKSVTVVFP